MHEAELKQNHFDFSFGQSCESAIPECALQYQPNNYQLYLTAHHLVKAHCKLSIAQPKSNNRIFHLCDQTHCTDRACWECNGVNWCVVTSHALHVSKIPPTVRSGQWSQSPDSKFVLSSFGKRSNSQYCYQYVYSLHLKFDLQPWLIMTFG